MFGYYGPSSLRVQGNHAAISLIDVAEGTVPEIEITTPEEARRIAAAIRMQRQKGISALRG